MQSLKITFNDIPNELIAHSLSFLDEDNLKIAEQVSKRMKGNAILARRIQLPYQINNNSNRLMEDITNWIALFKLYTRSNELAYITYLQYIYTDLNNIEKDPYNIIYQKEKYDGNYYFFFKKLQWLVLIELHNKLTSFFKMQAKIAESGFQLDQIEISEQLSTGFKALSDFLRSNIEPDDNQEIIELMLYYLDHCKTPSVKHCELLLENVTLLFSSVYRSILANATMYYLDFETPQDSVKKLKILIDETNIKPSTVTKTIINLCCLGLMYRDGKFIYFPRRFDELREHFFDEKAWNKFIIEINNNDFYNPECKDNLTLQQKIAIKAMQIFIKESEYGFVRKNLNELTPMMNGTKKIIKKLIDSVSK